MCKKAVSFSCSFEESGKGEDREVDPLMIGSAVSRDTSLSDHVHRRSSEARTGSESRLRV